MASTNLPKHPEDYKPTGKIKSLVEIFEKTYPNSDKIDLLAGIWHLEKYSWSPQTVELVNFLYDAFNSKSKEVDSGLELHLHELINLAIENTPNKTLSDNEKLEMILETSKSNYSGYSFNQLKPIIASLQMNDPSV